MTIISFGAADMIFNFVPQGVGNVQFKNKTKWDKSNSYQKLESIIDIFQKSNLDFIELGAAWLNETNLEVDPKKVESILQDKNIKVHSVCSLLPKELNIFNSSNEKLRKYFEILGSNIQNIKPQVLVFGSGAARNKPDYIEHEVGYKRFAEVIDMIIEVMSEKGLKDTSLLIETLSKEESNFVNNSDQAIEVLKHVKTNKAGILFDIFHWYREEKSWQKSYIKHKSYIEHIHIADPVTRENPSRNGQGVGTIREMLNLLKINNYRKSISFECVFNDIELQMSDSLSLLKEFAE